MNFDLFISLNKTIEAEFLVNRQWPKNESTCKIQQLPLEIRQQAIQALEKHVIWQEYDYCLYIHLVKGNEELSDLNIALVQVLNALTCRIKELVIAAMELIRVLNQNHSRIDLRKLMSHYFNVWAHKTPDMCYYAYLLPTIRMVYGTDGLNIVQEIIQQHSIKEHSILYMLHTLSFFHRITYSNFISSFLGNTFSSYDNPEVTSLLFELICKRRESSIPFENSEIEFVVNNLAGINVTALNSFKYFMSHLSISYNKSRDSNETGLHWFDKIQNTCFRLLMEEDTVKISQGVKIYSDFYNVVIKSQYKAMYTVTKRDIYDAYRSPIYAALLKRNKLHIDDVSHLPHLLLLMNQTNFHLLVEVLSLHDCSCLLAREKIMHLYNHLEDDYLEDKIDRFARFIVNNWYQSEVEREALIILCLSNIERTSRSSELNYSVYRDLKMMSELLGQLKINEIELLEEYLRIIIDQTINDGKLSGNKCKLYERILVSALELLVQLASGKSNLDEFEIGRMLNYIEKGIFCNKRYAASASGFIYKKFVARHFPAHSNSFMAYLDEVLNQQNRFNPIRSNMRRSLEKRTLLQEFYLAVDRKYRYEVVVKIYEVCYNKMQHSLVDDANCDGDDVRSCIFCVNALMADASLKQTTNGYVFELIEFCIGAVDVFSTDFALCNAVYTLYGTLVQRILPYHNNTKNFAVGHLRTKLSAKTWSYLSNLESMSKSKILLSILLQRSNNECTFGTSDEFTCKLLEKLEEHLLCFDSSRLCTFSTDSVIKLWLNLTPLEKSEELLQKVQNTMPAYSTPNSLNVRYKILDGLARKCNYLTYQRNLKQSICANYDKKMRVSPPSCLRAFGLKELTIARSLERILNESSSIYDKITAFEFFFEFLVERNELNVFIDKFLMLYINALVINVKQSNRKLDNFSMSLNTIVYCLDKVSGNLSCFSMIDYKDASMKSNFLPFITILHIRCRQALKHVDNEDLERKIVENYSHVAQNIDTFEQDDAESILIGYKYLKDFMQNDNEALTLNIFVTSMQFLHSKLLSDCDYLRMYILEALGVRHSNRYLTANDLRRFLMSRGFLDQYFTCERMKIRAGLKYLHWSRTKLCERN